ncbi:hypothetical protein BDW66DRAFT_134532 [Aspergillus desertorum]
MRKKRKVLLSSGQLNGHKSRDVRERVGRALRRGKKVEGGAREKRRKPQKKGITDRIGGDKDKVITGKLRPGCGGLDGLVWSGLQSKQTDTGSRNDGSTGVTVLLVLTLRLEHNILLARRR